MADYQFGLPEPDPLEDDEDANRPRKIDAPPQPKFYPDTAPLETPTPSPTPITTTEAQFQQPLVKNTPAIKRGAQQFPVEPPPDVDVTNHAPDAVAPSKAPVFTDAMPPTAGKLPFFETSDVPRPQSNFDTAPESVSQPFRGSTRPRRPASAEDKFDENNVKSKGSKPKQTFGDTVPIAQYYFNQVKFVLTRPSDFFSEMEQTSEPVEAAIFMAITVGICCILQAFSGNFWALFNFIGHIFCVAAAAFMGVFAFQKLEPGKGDFKTLFQIFAYCQAPKLLGWISLGPIPIGYIVASAYGLYLGCIAFNKIYDMSKAKSALIIAVLFLIARAIAGVLHLF